MLNKRLKKIREILKLTQEKMADFLNVNRSFLAQIETGLRKPSEQTLYVLEKELGISKEWLETGQGVIFSDPEKGLNYIFKKDSLTVEEIFFLLNCMQYVYSYVKFLFFDKSFTVKKDYCLNLLTLANNFGFKIFNGYSHEQVEELLNSESIKTLDLCDSCISYIMNYISEKEFLLPQNEIDLLNQNLLPWAFYVAKAFVQYKKRKFIPMPGIFIDIEIKELDKYLSFEIDNFDFALSDIKLSHRHNHIIFKIKTKTLIEIEKEKFFALKFLFEQVKTYQSLKILDFEMFYDGKTAHLKQGNISVVFSIKELDQIKNLFSRIMENKSTYNHLQACFVENFGFT